MVQGLIIQDQFCYRIGAPRRQKFKCGNQMEKLGKPVRVETDEKIKNLTCGGSCGTARDHIESWRWCSGCGNGCGEMRCCRNCVCDGSGGVNIFCVFVCVVCVVL